MATTQIGTDLVIGVGQTMGSYIVESYDEGGDEIKSEDIFDEDGALKTRLIMQSMDRITLNLVAISGAAPDSDFAEGAICAVAPLSNYYIESLTVSRTEGARRATVTGVNLGIT
ncbi:unnamed protein product [marine sediment metagenome]|uniref:Uncharacterized protein n=1 Tax=marine sediment metagenome TaxID=412755 RepID=X0ZIL5_9ZZZZ